METKEEEEISYALHLQLPHHHDEGGLRSIAPMTERMGRSKPTNDGRRTTRNSCMESWASWEESAPGSEKYMPCSFLGASSAANLSIGDNNGCETQREETDSSNRSHNHANVHCSRINYDTHGDSVERTKINEDEYVSRSGEKKTADSGHARPLYLKTNRCNVTATISLRQQGSVGQELNREPEADVGDESEGHKGQKQNHKATLRMDPEESSSGPTKRWDMRTKTLANSA
ncbi:hypothetical protein Ancab_015115 [Ancistrocladus abbreviatus]